MAALPTVGVHDDLAAGQAAVAHGTAHDEFAGGVDEVFGIAVDHLAGNNLFNDVLDDGLADGLEGDVRFVLG